MAGHDLVDDPDGVRASIGVTGQFSAVDELLTGQENLRLMADLNHLGRAAGHSGRAGYLNYITPGILLMTVAAAVQGTAIVVAMDMTGGIIDRFRTMAIARSAVLTGHVLASLIQSLLSLGIVLGVAVALGFRPQADLLDWLAAVGLLTLFAFALIWLATALGLAAKSVETASNTPMFLTFLPFLGSGFVLLASMPTGLRQFAHYQPFTPITETLRGLLTGTPIGTNAIVASPGASPSPSPPTSGPNTTTHTDARPEPDRPRADALPPHSAPGYNGRRLNTTLTGRHRRDATDVAHGRREHAVVPR